MMNQRNLFAAKVSVSLLVTRDERAPSSGSSLNNKATRVGRGKERVRKMSAVVDYQSPPPPATFSSASSRNTYLATTNVGSSATAATPSYNNTTGFLSIG